MKSRTKYLLMTKFGFMMVAGPMIAAVFVGEYTISGNAARGLLLFMLAGAWLSGWGYGNLNRSSTDSYAQAS